MAKQNFFAGSFIDGSRGETFKVMEPATGELLDEVAQGTPEDVAKMVDSAWDAFHGGWKNTLPAERAKFLRKIADGIRARFEEISRIEARNVGKPIGDARWEVNAGAEIFDYYAGAIAVLGGEIPPVSKPGITLTIRQPIGVAACIVPWNYPFMMACSKVAPALAAGNAAILKPASYTPLSAVALAEVIRDADLPKGVFHLISGPGGIIGNAIVENPKVGKISFTGETTTGAEILKRSADNITRVSLELGGKSPNIICQDADIDRAASSSPLAVFGNTGQDCCARSRTFVHEKVYDEFLEKFTTATRNLVIGDPLDEKTDVGPLISEKQRQISIDYMELGKKEGARVHAGGEILSGGVYDKGFFLSPAILVDVRNSMQVCQEEIFGPVVCVVKYSDEEEMIRQVNDCKYGLSGSIWSQDISRALRIAKAVESGVLSINCNNSVFNEAPFGGYKLSGIGRERGKYGLELFSEVKNIFVWIGS